MAHTQIADVVVPEIFTPYVQQLTEQKTRLIQSGVISVSDLLNEKLAGGGLTFNMPSWKDLDADAENVSTDDVSDAIAADYGAGTPATRLDAVPKKTGSATEIVVRCNRNQHWSSADLAANLAGSDPMESIAQRVSTYWARRDQAAFIAVIKGIFRDNAAAPDAAEHVANDMTFDISGAAYSEGVTDFSAEAFIDAAVTMGDSSDAIVALMVHSIVYARMLKNDLIDFVKDSTASARIPTFMGREVIQDDSMPRDAETADGNDGSFESWLFGAGSVVRGNGTAPMPTEVSRQALAGQGGGGSVLSNRRVWCLHPVGHQYQGTPADGGPSNANTANNLAHLDSWKRVYSERKQIKIARLVTREAAATIGQGGIPL